METARLNRGFNRLYLVFAVGWSIYCVLIYPEMKSMEFTNQWMEDQKGCYVDPSSVRTEADIPIRMEESQKCFQTIDRNYQAELSMWTGKGFYVKAWWLLLIAAVGFPIVLYGCCRGVAALAAWVWRGFQQRST